MQTKRYAVRFNQVAFENLSTDADLNGMNISEWIRYKLGFESKTHNKRIIFLLNKTNNNINQIGKGMGMAYLRNHINEDDYAQVLTTVSAIKNDFKNIYNLIEES